MSCLMPLMLPWLRWNEYQMNNHSKRSTSVEKNSIKRMQRFACGREHSSHQSPCLLSVAKMLSLLGILASLMCACQTPSAEQPALPPLQKMGQVVIQWPTDYGADVYGFNIYRGESAQGPFVRINADIISTSTGKDKEFHRYIDKPLELGKTYFYYIESISYAGQKTKITPVIPVNAKS